MRVIRKGRIKWGSGCGKLRVVMEDCETSEVTCAFRDLAVLDEEAGSPCVC